MRRIMVAIWLSVILVLVMTQRIVVGPGAEGRPVADGPDPEVRELAPTRVPRDLASKSLPEAFDELGRATGFPLRLTSEGRSAPERKTGVRSPEDGATFWEILDPLARKARLEIRPAEGMTPGLGLKPAKALPASSTVYGAFRCSLVGMIETRRIAYGDQALVLSHPVLKRPARMEGKNLPPILTRSYAVILLLAEPRIPMRIELFGPPRLTEAVDDKGRSLVVSAPKYPIPTSYRFEGQDFYAKIHLRLDLQDPPARSVRRLRGVLPIVAWIEHPEPLDVDITPPTGRVLRGSGVKLELIFPRKSSPEGTIELLMSPEEPAHSQVGANGFLEAGPGRMFLHLERQFEVRDEAGNRIEMDVRTEPDRAPKPWRVVLTPKRGFAKAVPSRLRYRGLSWSRTNVPFAFEEIPLP